MSKRLKMMLLLPALLLCMSFVAGAQTVSGQFNNTPLKTVLAQIESQSGYTFMFRNEDISSAPAVTASFKDVSVTEALNKVLGNSFTYQVKGKNISITKATSQPKPQTPAPSQARKITVSGRAVDQAGEPIIGAAVTVKDNPAFGGSVTDLDGKFSIVAPEGAVLVTSCIGYVPVEFPASTAVKDIVLNEDTEMIEETVVVGYGIQKKESVVGAIATVNSEALVNSGQTNITQAMAGKVSGLYSFQTSGQPGADDASFVLRGESSWNGSEPLVMVDGVERSFVNLDPNEVESISVLKDASATAVFGAKGANGVILVTTKRGQVGKTKTHLSVNVGMETPTMLPEVYDAETILRSHNLSMKNDGMYGSQHSEELISKYKSGENPIRYPDNNWYDLMLKDFAPSTNVNYGVSGGTEKVRYYVNLGYKYEGSIVKNLPGMNKNFSVNRINYRANIDYDVTKTTTVSARFGGFTKIVTRPMSASGLFTDMYNGSTIQYPAYFPASVLEQYPDIDYPNASGMRRSDKDGNELGAAYYANPFSAVASGDFSQTINYQLSTDLEVNQKLDFVTKGLSLNGKISYVTDHSRKSREASLSYPTYHIDWAAVDSGTGNPWVRNTTSIYVFEDNLYEVSQSPTPSDIVYNFYWEASARYNRTFGDHDVSALALMHQRNYVTGVDYPSRTQAYVGRVNYAYKGKYLFEGNMGITGSEQFSPKNRYGVFPSLAVGYHLSKEPFFKNAFPWWSNFKIRYSDGLVGSDAATEKWLYYSSWARSNGYVIEGKAANETARWEMAHKRNLGFEFGWFNDNLVMNVDLFNEDRTGILTTPLTTIFVVVDYKDVNSGAIKKHGMEVELKWRNTTDFGLYYEIGGSVALNENRITAYEDAPYAPDYQKRAGKAYGASSIGESLIDSRFFGTIDQKHGYPGANNINPQGRDYMFLDYNADGDINNDDRHPVEGSFVPPVTYTGHIALGWKNLSFDATLMGAHGKYIGMEDVYYIEFYKGDYILHANSMNYWTPTNNNANHASLSALSGAISKFGRTDAIGTNCDIVDVLWQDASFLSIKDVRLAYKLKTGKVCQKLGVQGMSLTLTANNLHTFTRIKDADPEINDLQNSYYPIMRNVKLGVNLDF